MDDNAKYAEYACGAAQAGSPDRPYLSRLGEAADELARVGDYIQDFIDRCRGCADSAKTAGPVPVPSGHLGQLERLTENLSRVDKLARELQTIG